MSYDRMWEPDPPSKTEIEVERVKKSGGTIVKHIADIPTKEHYAIIAYVSFDCRPENRHVVYTNREQWQAEIERLALASTPFLAFIATPAQVKVVVDVSTYIEGKRA